MSSKYNGFEKYIFSDAYLIFLKFKDIKTVQEYWKVLDTDLDTFKFKYKNHPLAVEMAHLVRASLEHKNYNTVINGLDHEQWDKELQVAKDTKPWNPDAWKYK